MAAAALSNSSRGDMPIRDRKSHFFLFFFSTARRALQAIAEEEIISLRAIHIQRRLSRVMESSFDVSQLFRNVNFPPKRMYIQARVREIT